MACKIKTNRHGLLALQLFWDGVRSWEGTHLKDTPENRRLVEAKALIIADEMKKGTFDYLEHFPNGNKAYLFRQEETKSLTTHTVKSFFNSWIKKQGSRVRPHRVKEYISHFNRHILKAKGNLSQFSEKTESYTDPFLFILDLMVTTNSHPRETRFAEFRFYEELNDFLSAEQRKTSFRSPFFGSPSVKDTIQAIGVPHTAIDLILVDGQSVDFSHRLRGGERVAVYPVFERLDISPVIRLRPRPLRCTRFILDVHLGKLARYLRMLGFDTAYDRDRDNSTLIDLSLRHERIILTRDLTILKQSRVTHGYWLRHRDPRQQLQEILLALDLFRQLQPFTRCMDCNGGIHPVNKAVIRMQIDPNIFQQFREFWQCQDCGKIYWRGSHYESMLQLVSNLSQEHI